MYNAKIEQECAYRGTRNNTWYYRIDYSYHSHNGNWVFNHITRKAICSSGDKYNEEFGRNLAKTKAYEAYHHRVKKLMIAETYRPEWKKKQKMSFEAICLKDDDRLSFVLTGIQDKDRVLKEVNRKFDAGKDIKVTIEEI